MGGDREGRAQRSLYRPGQPFEDEVVAGGDDADVELEIGFAARFQVRLTITLHSRIGLLDSGEIRRRRAFGRERRGRGLNDPPRLDQACDQHFVASDVGVPGENLRVEEIPIVPAADPHADGVLARAPSRKGP